jgi:hypothetical protein
MIIYYKIIFITNIDKIDFKNLNIYIDKMDIPRKIFPDNLITTRYL